MSVSIARRQLLQRAAAIVGALTTSHAIAAACAASDGSDSGLRSSLHYTESSLNPAQVCSGCSFFSEPQGACGKCTIFGGPTNLNGHCDSWSAR
jgi:hypothetical protein